MALTHNHDATEYADRQATITAAKAAMATCQTIIDSIDAADITQAKTAIGLLAQHQKKIIRLLVGQVV